LSGEISRYLSFPSASVPAQNEDKVFSDEGGQLVSFAKPFPVHDFQPLDVEPPESEPLKIVIISGR
tara:strand:+ start:766 stop:963 length:198 start_codon:yes stop_codon:yes gene_type:complete